MKENDISKVMVEKIDILAEMEVLNRRMREVVIKDTTLGEKIKAYDIGVKNTMSALKSLITHSADGEKDRLIYQRYAEQSNVVRYMLLTDALKELESTGQLYLAENGGENGA